MGEDVAMTIFSLKDCGVLSNELIYIYSFEDGKHLTEEVKKWFNFYNKERFHQALEYQIPDQVYWTSLNLA